MKMIDKARRWIIGAVLAISLALSSCFIGSPAYADKEGETLPLLPPDCHTVDQILDTAKRTGAVPAAAWVDWQDPNVRMVLYYASGDNSVSMVAFYSGAHPLAGHACFVSSGWNPTLVMPSTQGERGS